MTAMEELLVDLTAQHAELAAVLSGLDEADWARPSRCEGWSVADVVTHLAQADELAVASLAGTFDGALGGAANVDEWAAAVIDAEPDRTPAEVLARWTAATEASEAGLRASEPNRRVTWVAGTLSAQTLAATRLAECWIHTGDIADLAPTERLRHVARLAWRTLPYAFTRAGRDLHGPVAFRLTGPSGAPWAFEPAEPATTVITGDGVELCDVAGQRRAAATTSLTGTGPDVAAVLQLVRTFA
ncbi:MAG: wyosine base formation [Actinomycetia bacterium]|nr:wyosine base formation [Actinomycetes bacterium]